MPVLRCPALSCFALLCARMASSGHDISDIFLDLMKMANYLKVEGAHGYYVTEICFVLNTYVSWPYLRLYVFPLHIIWGTLPRRPASGAPCAVALWRFAARALNAANCSVSAPCSSGASPLRPPSVPRR